MDSALSTQVAEKEDLELLTRAQEMVELFQRAIKLGYSITFTPEQLRVLLTVCEEGHLTKEKSSGKS